MNTDRISVVGIHPQEGSIGPLGNHLRWMFPLQLGFPPGGFQVYRRAGGTCDLREPDWDCDEPNPHCLNFCDLGELPTGPEFDDDMYISYPDEVNWEWVDRSDFPRPYFQVEPSNVGDDPPLLQLHFTKPITCLRLVLGNVPKGIDLTLNAYSGQQFIGASSDLIDLDGHRKQVQVMAPYITLVTVALTFGELHAICFKTVEDDCKDDAWEGPVELPLLGPGQVDQALERLPDPAELSYDHERLHNYYTASYEEAKAQYEPELPRLLETLELLQNPSSPSFENPNAAPHQLRLRANDTESPLSSIHPQSMLLLAALDPNIARFLSLYWVDVFLEGEPQFPGGPPLDQSWDYKIEGLWPGHDIGCGLIFGLGGEAVSLPTVADPLTGQQLPGLRWQGKTAYGRVGLNWPRPSTNQGAVQPVLFDVERLSIDSSPEPHEEGVGSDPEPALPTTRKPVLVPAKSWDSEAAVRFVDANTPLGAYSYQLRGIDLFGQISQPIQSDPITVEDLLPPPPPIRLRATLHQPGYPWRTGAALDEVRQTEGRAELDLQFEYGASQHQQAPDAATFHVYWRPDSLFDRIEVKATLVDGNRLYNEVKLTGVSQAALKRYANGVLTNVRPDQPVLPAKERHRFRIIEILDGKRIRLEPDETFVNDNYQLISDPHSPDSWQVVALSEQDIEVRPPLTARLMAVKDAFQASAAGVIRLEQHPDPWAAHLTADPPEYTEEPQATLEILLNIPLAEPDLLRGGKVHIGNRSYKIQYSTAGPAARGSQYEATAARVGLVTNDNIAPGQPIMISLSPDLQPRVRVLMLSSSGPLRMAIRSPHALEGEIALEGVDSVGQPTIHIMRAISGLIWSGEAYVILVRMPDIASTTLEGEGFAAQDLYYYAPYRFRAQADIVKDTGALLDLRVHAQDGVRHAYFAVSIKDTQGNEGPLSVAVQVTAVKPPPLGRPGSPYLCQLGAEATTGYATPPDRQGRATVCLAWDAGDLESTEGLRYEVFRALDNTVIATDRRNWLLGRSDPGLPAIDVHSGIRFTGNVSTSVSSQASIDTNGTIPVRVMIPPEIEVQAEHLRGGRLSKPIPGASPLTQATFQITNARLEADNGVSLILRPMNFHLTGTEPDGNSGLSLRIFQQEQERLLPLAGDAEIEGPPNYTDVLTNDEELRRLAEKTGNEEAFGLVTGMPIPDARFRDEVPGIGRNRFFYRVRAVDAAENRSAWSAVSVPFYQVDMTPPETPLLRGRGGDLQAVLTWPANIRDNIVAYHLYRADRSNQLDLISPNGLYKLLSPSTGSVAYDPSSDNYRYIDEFEPLTTPEQTIFYRLVAVKRAQFGNEETAFTCIPHFTERVMVRL